MTLPSEFVDGAPSISADDLEQQIGTLIPRNTLKLDPTRFAPMPDYFAHQEGVSRVGALSAEAVARDFEAAAKEIEAMGPALVGAASKCEAMTANVHRAIAFMHETATAYREEANKIVARIE